MLSPRKARRCKFIPVDRINTLIAVAPNPGVFVEVKNWIDKLESGGQGHGGLRQELTPTA